MSVETSVETRKEETPRQREVSSRYMTTSQIVDARIADWSRCITSLNSLFPEEARHSPVYVRELQHYSQLLENAEKDQT
jgi:hypothetical protein